MSAPMEDPELLELPHRILISDLCQLLETYLLSDQVKEVYRAFLYGAEAHDGQTRRSGEPYINHPIAVAYTLGQMHLDVQTLCAALLHDVIEDTKIDKPMLAGEFGSEIAELVDGVSKLNMMHFETREEAQAASFQKMLLAMNRDLRVILVKLADRLHNMRTISYMKRASQRRIARETLEIYAPIAARFGMNRMRIELQDLSFKTLYPWRYSVFAYRVRKLRQKRLEHLKTIQETLQNHLQKRELNAKVQERKRHYYSYYTKVNEHKHTHNADRKKSFAEVSRAFHFIIIVESVDACYRALGVVHNLYKPKIEAFRDHIAIPKINGYQGLHTEILSPYSIPIEIQIRSLDMHEMAEKGITAHDIYQFNQDSDPQTGSPVRQRASEWLRGLMDMPKAAQENSIEFMKQVKRDLFSDEVYVFTPKGKILQLPKGATPIDFAYAVHSDVGDKCIAVKVDNAYASLDVPLKSGQTVAILTAAWARPNPRWLNFAVSARARGHILHYLRTLEQDKAMMLGKRLLNRELSDYDLAIDKLNETQVNLLLKTFKIQDLDTLLSKIGLGDLMAPLVARHLNNTHETVSNCYQLPMNASCSKPLPIKGSEGILVTFARCCRPIPEDDIIGFMSKGKGLTIHRAACKHVDRSQADKLLAVEWADKLEDEFLVDIHVDVFNQRGVLAIIAAEIANMGSNIETVSSQNLDGMSSEINLCISVRNRNHLADLLRHLRHLDSVKRVHRMKYPNA